jgi:hypothetical protein
MANANQAGGFNILMTVTPNGGGAAPANGPTCVIQYGSESATVAVDGRTIRQLFEANAEALGFERNRPVVFRTAGTIVDGGRLAEAGRTYVAAVTYEQKGL